MGRRVELRPVIHFIQFDWGYTLAHLLAFIYGGVIIGYWVFPFMLVFHKLLAYLRSKDPEAFKVIPKAIKGRALLGTNFPVDLTYERTVSEEVVKKCSGVSDSVKSVVRMLKRSIPSISFIKLREK